MIEELLRLGADIDTRDYRRNTLLHLVREEEVFQILVRSGAGVNLYNIDGMTPLFVCKRIDFARMLIDAGADVNFQIVGNGCCCADNQIGCTPLHLCNSIDMARLLIKHGADVNKTASEGTPLHYHCARGHNEIIRLLVRRGADLNAVNSRGMTPFMYIRDNNVRDKLSMSLGLIETEHGLERKPKEKKISSRTKTPINSSENDTTIHQSSSTKMNSVASVINPGTENRQNHSYRSQNIDRKNDTDNGQIEQIEEFPILRAIISSLSELLPNRLKNAIRLNRKQKTSQPQTNSKGIEPNINQNINKQTDNNETDYRFDLDFDEQHKKVRKNKATTSNDDHRFDLDFEDNPSKRRKKRSLSEDKENPDNRYDLDFDD